jgi:hypothetical protein
MSEHFPRMIYKVGGPHEIHGGLFHYRTVHDDEELAAALDSGWSMTTHEAEAVSEKPPVEIPMDAPPTRDELKRKAKELGIEFPANIPTDKLAALVADKVKE